MDALLVFPPRPLGFRPPQGGPHYSEFLVRAVTSLGSERMSFNQWRCLRAPSSRWARPLPWAYGAWNPKQPPQIIEIFETSNPSAQTLNPGSEPEKVEEAPKANTPNPLFSECCNQGSRSDRSVNGLERSINPSVGLLHPCWL